MKTLLLSLFVFSLAGPLAKADTLDYEYTWHVDGVVLPGDGIALPSITLAFLAGNDVRSYYPGAYYNGDDSNVTLLYLHESVSPSSPAYLNPFHEFSGFGISLRGIGLHDRFYMGSSDAGYEATYYGPPPPIVGFIYLPNPGETVSGPIYGYSYTFTYPNGDYESALTSYTLRLDIVPEPNAASLLALGLFGIVGLALWRKKYYSVTMIARKTAPEHYSK